MARYKILSGKEWKFHIVDGAYDEIVCVCHYRKYALMICNALNEKHKAVT